MTYSIIEKSEPNAETGIVVGVSKTPKAAITLAKARHEQTGKYVFVASRSNLFKPVFEIGVKLRGNELAKAMLANMK